jgi:hypothetical protein
MPITGTTNDVSMNPAHGEVYFIQHYVIKFVSELQQASTLGTLVSSTYKMDYHVLLKVALDTITLTIYEKIPIPLNCLSIKISSDTCILED